MLAAFTDVRSLRIAAVAKAVGVRNLEKKEPAQLTDQVHIGDITMSMVAVSVMKLVEDGMVRLDDPITEYLPEFENVIHPPGPVTVRSLLNHRSGMPHYWEVPKGDPETGKRPTVTPSPKAANSSTTRCLHFTLVLRTAG